MTFGQIENNWYEAEKAMEKPFPGHTKETNFIWFLIVSAGNCAVQNGYRPEHAREVTKKFIDWTKGGANHETV